MRYLSRIAALFTLLALLAAAPGELRSQENIEVTEVAEDLYFLTGVVCNVAFLVTDQGVLVVDSGVAAAHGDSIIAAIRKITDAPIKYLVFTHYHFDHVVGACRFPEGTVIVSHSSLPANQQAFNEPRLREMLEKTYPERIGAGQAKLDSLTTSGSEATGETADALRKLREQYDAAQEIRLVYPDTTFDEEMIIELGGQKIRLYHPGPAHTSGNLIVHFMDLGAVHMGDMLFYMRHPYIDWKAGSNTANWVRTLEEVAGWDIDVVIPGHGRLTDISGLKWKTQYLKDLRDEVRAAVDRGMSPDEAGAAVRMEKYADLEWPYMLDAGVAAVYKELAGEERVLPAFKE